MRASIVELDVARHQARQLLADRLAREAPLHFAERRPTRPLLTTCVLFVALAASVSGAWAHYRAKSPSKTAPVRDSIGAGQAQVAPSRATTSRSSADTTPPIAVIAANPKKRARRAAGVALATATPPTTAAMSAEPAAAPASGRVSFDEPDGDVVVGKAPIVLPPLFTVKEFKTRGVLVHDSK